jgi:hypothetical protein
MFDNLREARNQWEKGLTVVLAIPIIVGDWRKLFVILKTSGGDFRLHRYMKLGDGWDVSVDVACDGMDVCIRRIHEDKDVRDSYLKYLGEEP